MGATTAGSRRFESMREQGVRVRTSDLVESSMECYLREINEMPLLSAEEEKQLARGIKAGDRGARDRMIRANLRLVVSVARKFNDQGLPFQDLIAEGNLGLLRAVQTFDPARNTRFSTYAVIWIKQAIRRGLVKTARAIRLPSYVVELLGKWRWAAAELQKKLGRGPLDEEIASSLGLSAKKIADIRHALRMQNMTFQTEEPDESRPLAETLTDLRARSPSLLLDAAEEWQLVRARLDRLDERDAAVLRMRYGLDGTEPMTLEQVGAHFDLTRERVRQIERGAIKRLRRELATGVSRPGDSRGGAGLSPDRGGG